MSSVVESLKDYWWIITTFIFPVVTYLVGLYKKKNLDQDKRLTSLEEKQVFRTEALKTLLQAELTKTFYKYEKSGQVPSYVYRNWINLLNAYENLGGNDYIHEIYKKFREFKIIN